MAIPIKAASSYISENRGGILTSRCCAASEVKPTVAAANPIKPP